MKLISLNTWGGKVYKPLIKFIRQHSNDTDIFCFQEIFDTSSEIKKNSGFRTNIYSEITNILKNHQGYFDPIQDNYLLGSFQKDFTSFPLLTGLAIFIKKKFKVNSQGDFFVYGKRNSFSPKNRYSVPRNVQYLNFENNKNMITVLNIHGIWTNDKKDNPFRIIQSKKMIHFLNKQKGNKIICGDFNLDINTKSIGILEKKMENLIRKFDIPTTRSKIYPGTDKFADYTFVSKDIKVKKFEVPDIEISDHYPMILEFD